MKPFVFAVQIALASAAFAQTASADSVPQSRAPMQYALEAEKEYVYCADGHTTVETWDLEQMHVRYGQDVCLLHEGTVQSGARDWMDKNFPTGVCTC